MLGATVATSYNGWPASPDKGEIGVVKFGDAQGFPFPGGIKGGDVFTVLGYVATQLHERVESCVSGWCWGYTYKQNVNNPSQLSCHASATAIDWNAPDHPNGSSGTFSDSQRGTIYAILNEVQGAVNWLEGYDEMHFEIAVDASTLARIAASLPSGQPDPTPPQTEDWFDMATEDDLRRVIDERLAFYLPRMLNVMADGNPNQAFNDDHNNTTMLHSGGLPGLGKAKQDQQFKDLPINVWTKGISGGDAANELLTRAASYGDELAKIIDQTKP